MRLRTNLLLLVAAVAVPLIVVAGVLVLSLLKAEHDASRRAASDRVRAVMTAVDAKLLAALGAVDALSKSPRLRSEDLAGFYREATDIARAQPDWSAITLLTPEGKQLLNTARPYGAELPSLPADALAEVVRSRRGLVGNMFKAPHGDYAVPVRAPVVIDGELRYLVSAEIGLSAFERIIKTQDLEPREVLALVDRSGRFVARVPYQLPGGRATEDFMQHSGHGGSGWYRARVTEGEDRFIAYNRSDLSGWALGHSLLASEVYDETIRAGLILSVGIAVVLVLDLVLAFWLARRIVGPVASLEATAQSLLSGGPAGEGPVGRIDELRQVEKALSEASRAVRERQELLVREARALRSSDEAKSEFLTMLSHELRNPLAALVSAASLLQSMDFHDDKFKFARTVVERQTAQMKRLIDGLLDISNLTLGRGTVHMQPMDLAELVRGVAGAWQRSERLRGRNLLVRTEPVWVNADRERLEQVLANLIDNAAKFSPQGSQIEIEARADGAEAVLSVKDRGEGIEREVAEQLFGPLMQDGKDFSRRRGAGIGLALAKRLVELHSGSIGAASPGTDLGSTFTVRLPRIAEPSHAQGSLVSTRR
jgi:signal transduction histidine kinase